MEISENTPVSQSNKKALWFWPLGVGSITNNQLPAQDDKLFCYWQCFLIICLFNHDTTMKNCNMLHFSKEIARITSSPFKRCGENGNKGLYISESIFSCSVDFSTRDLISKEIIPCLYLYN